MKLFNLTLALCLAGCVIAPKVTPNQSIIGAGKTACVVRGVGDWLFSYPTAGTGTLEAFGYKVVVYTMFVSAATLEHCPVIVAHSAGAAPALKTKGPRLIFVIDRAPWAPDRCPEEARCINFYDLSGPLVGAHNIDCFTDCGAAGVLGIGHMIMPANQNVWDVIVKEIENAG